MGHWPIYNVDSGRRITKVNANYERGTAFMNSDDRVIINSFMSYMATHPEEDPFSSKWQGPPARSTSSDGYEIIGYLFIIGIVIIGIASPILCIWMLGLGDFEAEGAWVFWIITAGEIGYLVWCIIKNRIKKKRI